MQIGSGTVVTFHYSLKDEEGKELESNRDDTPQSVLYGRRQILAGLEEAIKGKTAGENISVSLPPEKAYGRRVENAVYRVPIKHLLDAPKRLKPGQVVYVNTKDGERNCTIVKVGKFNVDVDANHPFADRTLNFELDILDVREATREELAHSHAHGAGGHHH